MLTPREREVWGLICVGMVNKEIGARLGISIHTAEKHRNNLYRKGGFTNVAQCIAAGFRSGIAV